MDDESTFPTDDAWNDERLDTGDIRGAAAAVRELGITLRDLKEMRERHKRYFWKAFPFIWDDERLKQATIRREREHN